MIARRTARLVAAVAGLACGLALHLPSFAAADPNKVLHVAFEAADDGFDMARTNSLYSNWLVEAVLESPLEYDYLARPLKLRGNLTEGLPVISADGLTYTFKLKKGIFFTPDPAFKGVKRELVANDLAFTIKRHLDPKVRSVQISTFEKRIVGLDALVEAAKKSGKFDYDAPVAGLQTPDPYTLVMRLVEPEPNMIYNFANAATGVMAREVAEMYGEDVGRHPVGTGPYMLKQYIPRSKVVFEANPGFRQVMWNETPTAGDALDDKIAKAMRGKQLPQIGQVEVSIIEEEQARWLALDSGQLDFENIAEPASPKVLDKGKLKPEFVAKGLSLYRFIESGVTRAAYFNFKDPTVGGFTPEKIALRRAIAMAYDIDEEIAQVRFSQGIRARSYIPPNIAGHDTKYRSSIAYDPELAVKLLDHYGYKKGADGFRSMPDGSPLVLKIHSAPKTRDRAIVEIWKRSLDRVGIRAEFPVSSFADNLKAAYRCELMMWFLGGSASIPDSLNFLESYYGPAEFAGNFGCYKNKDYDASYDQAKVMPDSPERQVLIDKMQRILEADTVHVLGMWRIRNWLSQPWVRGFKKHPIVNSDWKYLDIQK